MKMKKYLPFLLIFALLTAAFTPNTVVAANSSGLSEDLKTVDSAMTDQNDLEEAIKIYEKKIEEQASAQEAYSVLRSMFDISAQGEDIYPSDYAGAWYKDGTLFIALTSFDQIQKYKDKLSEFDCISYVIRNLSLNELGKIRDEMYELVKNDIGISCFYIDVTENKIIYETSESQKKAGEKFYDIMSSSIAKLYKNANVATKLDESLFKVIEGDKIIEQTNIYGGDKFSMGSASGSSGSIGVCGTIHDNNIHYEGFITCGHGGMTVSGTNATIYLGDSIYGSTFYTMYYDNCYGDWAAIRKTSDNFTQTNMINGSTSAYTRNITGTIDELAEGMSFMKYGYNGGYCTGTVEENDINSVGAGGITIKGITRASLDSGSSLAGDSGGPYYTGGTDGNNYNFLGVHRGVSGSGSSQKIYFTPYKCFKTWFTPKTN